MCVCLVTCCTVLVNVPYLWTALRNLKHWHYPSFQEVCELYDVGWEEIPVTEALQGGKVFQHCSRSTGLNVSSERLCHGGELSSPDYTMCIMH